MGFRHNSPTRPITPDQHHHRHFPFKSVWMQRLQSIFVRDESRCPSPDYVDDNIDAISPWPSMLPDDKPKCPSSREKERPVTGLPRQTTFKRQNSERRERLCPNEPPILERRAVSAARQLSTSCVGRRRTRSSPPPVKPCRASAPSTAPLDEEVRLGPSPEITSSLPADDAEPCYRPKHTDVVFDYEERPSRPLSRASSQGSYDEDYEDQAHYDAERAQLNAELDTRWILNLSMHFRDKSDREKFFVTYAETPTKWRRVTVSCDYRHAESSALEMDLKGLHYQRDKSLAIYEAIRESLPDIQFYETVTNLKLETSEGRLHVHVTEDVNEIIPYPARSMVKHILDDENHVARPMELCEKDIAFDAHLSGFVYRVWHQNKIYIKKEIPSPDTIDEFLYEINALHSLNDSENVIKLEAIILDDTKQVVKGLLISFAERGAVVDILYDNKGRIPWSHREHWARQAVMGLRDIHEEGYVQGDFTLSNIVVDDRNNAKIIDINRRGCPVGWEPPEIAEKIASNQRISMYIGEKSDLYQLGMTLWALAMDDDEPERHDPPLMAEEFPSDVPEWFGDIVRTCLSQKPRDRLAAKELVKLFPSQTEDDKRVSSFREIPPRQHPTMRTEKQYIDPNAAVERDDIERFKQEEELLLYSPQSSKDDWTFTYPQSSEYDIESSASAFDGQRGRMPPSHTGHHSIDERLSRPLGFPITRTIDGVEPDIIDARPSFASDESDLSPSDQDINASELPKRTLSQIHLDLPPQHGCLTTMTLAPTLVPKSSSPFRLPNWQRSLSENTPRNSRIQLLADTCSDSPGISPRSSKLTLLAHPKTADGAHLQSCRSSNETISGCDVSVGETTFSGNTAFTHYTSSEVDEPGDKLNHKLSDANLQHDTMSPSKDSSYEVQISDPQICPRAQNPVTSTVFGADPDDNTTTPPAITEAKSTPVSTPATPLTLQIQDSGYDEPALHEMTKT